jgi:hypothetical protein
MSNRKENGYNPYLENLATLYPEEMQNVPSGLFNQALQAFFTSSDWVVNKYQIQDYPKINLGDVTNEKGVTGLVETEDGAVINIDISEFKLLSEVADFDSMVLQFKSGDFSAFISLRQWFEYLGVEETTHYAQELGLCETAVPPNEKRIPAGAESTDSDEYNLQPHEVEAALNVNEYFDAHYGKDHPLKDYLTYLTQAAMDRGNRDILKLLTAKK